MDRLKLSQWGERLKTGGAQMSRLVSDKMKEILQTPTPESKMVDEATSENLEEPSWGLNLRICAMINSEEFSGTEIVRTIKRKISGKNVASQRLSLDLLEICTMNCEKVFSEVASEKVLDEMVKLFENPQADQGSRDRAFQLIRAWGESEDLEYLPVFHQTYMSLKGRVLPPLVDDGNSFPGQYSLESYLNQPLPSAPERYHVTETVNESLSAEEKNEFLVTTQNSLELLSSILNAETEPKPIKEDLTGGLLEKCKHSQAKIQRIIQSTTGDEAMLFEALNLNDEIQQVITQYEEMSAGLKSGEQTPEPASKSRDEMPENGLKSSEHVPKTSPDRDSNLAGQVGHSNDTKVGESAKGEGTDSSMEKKIEEQEVGI